MLWDENVVSFRQLEAFLAAFVDPAQDDEHQLEAALRSVPEGNWSTVDTRLRVALEAEGEKHQPVAGNITLGEPVAPWIPDEDVLRLSSIVERKKHLLFNERNRRAQLRQGR